ncbi:Hypothetical protein BAN_0079100 [Borrelia anserina BA2]|uniref:Uncharacterized protein n=1 Tax=Borrelia anserina BA2 TaxID=1313293 RepID=W5SN30_BORAN|nr:Hypothetical protein BAN_0079100 [Borrelia anserina BA2]
MLKANNTKTTRIITGLIAVLQIVSSILILTALFIFAERTIPIQSHSIRLMIAFIIFSPELCVSMLTIHYVSYEQFKILHNLITITKTFQIIMSILLIILGLSLDLIKLLHIHQLWFLILLVIIITYAIFNTMILILIKVKNKIME